MRLGLAHRPCIPVAFETAWVLAALAQANLIADLCSGTSLVCRRHVSSSVLGIGAFSRVLTICDFIFIKGKL